MVLRAIETDSMDRVEDIVGRLIDLFNSYESREFLENKMQQARNGLERLERAMKSSLYEGMKEMRQLVTEIRIHLWSGNSAISRFQFHGQSLHYLLTRASDVLKDDSLSIDEKVKKIWYGITESLTEDEDRERAKENLEKFILQWRQGCRLPEDKKTRLEKQIREDFERGLEQQQSDIEDLFNQLREHFQELRNKLEDTQQAIRDEERQRWLKGAAIGGGCAIAAFAAGGLPGIVVGSIIGAAVGAARETKKAEDEIVRRCGERFLNRKNPEWYPRIENSLFNYIRGNTTDDELWNLIERESLEKDLHHIREHLQGWISSCHNLLDDTKIPKLNRDAFVLEARRMWAFAKALLLDDSEYVQHHSELLSMLINAALSSGDDVSTFISIARLPDGSQTLKMKLIVRQAADMRAVHKLICDIAERAGPTRGPPRHSVGLLEDPCEYEISFKEMDGIRRFLGVLAKLAGKLAEVHVRVALLGEYDVNVGSRLTNPAFNRIYGRGLTAPGFRPTVFNFLDYSGEVYYCPTGWRRISINVADSAAEFDRKYGGWHVAYHGTNHELAATILTSGFMPAVGARSGKEEVVYFSPSIEYAGHPRYAKVYEHNDRRGEKKYMQMVLQVRINPMNIWKKVGGTLPGAFDPSNRYYKKSRDNPPADPNFPKNQNLEWLVKPIPGTSGMDMFKNMCVIYGIMIRVSDTDPKNNPDSQWWQKKL